MLGSKHLKTGCFAYPFRRWKMVYWSGDFSCPMTGAKGDERGSRVLDWPVVCTRALNYLGKAIQKDADQFPRFFWIRPGVPSRPVSVIPIALSYYTKQCCNGRSGGTAGPDANDVTAQPAAGVSHSSRSCPAHRKEKKHREIGIITCDLRYPV